MSLETITAIYGGSFNPPTTAHRDIGLLLLEKLPINEVWYLVTPQNPFKSAEDMASFENRVTMAKINVDGEPGLIVKDIEAKYAALNPDEKVRTATTLKHLSLDFEDRRFVIAIGADNFADMHLWGNANYIIDNYPIAVIPRKDYTEAALNSPIAHYLPRLTDPEDMRDRNGWYLIDTPETDINATACRDALREGNLPAAMRPGVARYALDHNLYQIVPR